MRYAIVLLAACHFDPSGVGSDAFVDPNDDGGGVAKTWRADTVADFSAQGATLDDAIVEPWGAIGPAAWLTGHLLSHGSNSELFTSQNGDEWNALAAATPDGNGLSLVTPVSWAGDYPRGVGITGGDSFTYWAEGEVYLDAGIHQLSLYGDDVAFVDLAPPGGTFARAITAAYPSTVAATFDAAAAGWYGIHIADAEGIGDADLRFLVDGQPIDPDRLRVRADALTGLAEDGFDDEHLLAPIGPFLHAGDAFDYTPSDNDLAALGFTDHDHLSMRWTGQVRIDTAGAYELRLDTDDGHRLWVDGALALDHMTEAPEDHTTAALDLDAGWHDLVADLEDNTGSQHIRMIVATGPALAGQSIPVAATRPVAPRLERARGGTAGGGDITNPGTLTIDVAPGAPAASTATAVELGITLNHPAWSELEIAVIAPDGTAIVAMPAGSSTATGTATARFTVPAIGEAANGVWHVRVRDQTGPNGHTGTVSAVSLTVRYRGGSPPIATSAVWTSPAVDLGDVVGIDAVTWAGRLPALSVRVRTCDTADACASAEWSPAISQSGTRPAVLAKRFAQIEATLTSDGDQTPSLDWIQLAYRGGA